MLQDSTPTRVSLSFSQDVRASLRRVKSTMLLLSNLNQQQLSTKLLVRFFQLHTQLKKSNLKQLQRLATLNQEYSTLWEPFAQILATRADVKRRLRMQKKRKSEYCHNSNSHFRGEIAKLVSRVRSRLRILKLRNMLFLFLTKRVFSSSFLL